MASCGRPEQYPETHLHGLCIHKYLIVASCSTRDGSPEALKTHIRDKHCLIPHRCTVTMSSSVSWRKSKPRYGIDPNSVSPDGMPYYNSTYQQPDLCWGSQVAMNRGPSTYYPDGFKSYISTRPKINRFRCQVQSG